MSVNIQKGGLFIKLYAVIFVLCTGICACALPDPEKSSHKYDEFFCISAVKVSDGHERRIQAVYGKDNHRFEIDGYISVSDQPLYSGVLSSFSPDFKDIQMADFWLGSYVYENLSLDKNYAQSDSFYVMKSRKNESCPSFAYEMKERVMEIYSNMDLEMEYVNTIYCEGESAQGTQDNCIIETVTLLDGLPLISEGTGDYMRCFCKIGMQGVSRMFVEGIFKMDSVDQVSVMSLHEILKIIETGVEEKKINAYNKITGIALAYMFSVEEEKNIFYPVWCFSTTIEDTNIDWPLLCVNAQTGHIVYMSP